LLGFAATGVTGALAAGGSAGVAAGLAGLAVCAAVAGGSFNLSSAAKEGNGAAIRLTERNSRALEVMFIRLIRI